MNGTDHSHGFINKASYMKDLINIQATLVGEGEEISIA